MAMKESGETSTLNRVEGNWVATFPAMAGVCEVLMEVDDRQDAERILSIVSTEARRVENRFSRYLPDNIVHTINRGAGAPIEVDDETGRLLDFAAELHRLSDGKFDITSGVLRAVWTFDGSDRIPSPESVDKVREHVGWERVGWDGRRIRLEPDMEIDLGGIGKEYAVDQAARLVSKEFQVSCLINFSGDLVVTRPRADRKPWRVGIEAPDSPIPKATRLIQLTAGGLATSGDSKRFLLKNGVRYGHILDPTTGWPIANAPRSITVAAGTCVQAGMIATLAMLQGAEAKTFLEAQKVQFWIV
jgi:thiamine biosynthesis lipoprotein